MIARSYLFSKNLAFLLLMAHQPKRYLDYRDGSRSRTIMGEALKEAYADVFHVSEKPTDGDRAAIEGKFKSALNSSDRVAEAQALTFMSLLKLAELSPTKTVQTAINPISPAPAAQQGDIAAGPQEKSIRVLDLRYNVEIHLPPSKDSEVFNAIFKALKEHLLG